MRMFISQLRLQFYDGLANAHVHMLSLLFLICVYVHVD
jgi:hypothetical protein